MYVGDVDGCADACEGESTCGYFAFTSTGYCSLYTLADGCPDDNEFPEYTAYELIRGPEYTAYELIRVAEEFVALLRERFPSYWTPTTSPTISTMLEVTQEHRPYGCYVEPISSASGAQPQ